MKFTPLVIAVAALMLAGGCKPKPMDIPAIQRKEAANLASEAQFAATLRDFARAEPLFEKAAKMCPDEGDYWINLGIVRRRQDNKSGAKDAYEKGRSAFSDAAAIHDQDSEPVLQEIYALALLGRADDARKVLAKAQKRLPDDRALKAFAESNQLDRMLEDPGFKEIAL
jgi:tetratricopeptide (TPR) repeat protein